MPLPLLKLTYTFTDESEQVITTRLFRCTADEIAFERRFGYPARAKYIRGAPAMQRAEREATNGDVEERRIEALAGMDMETRSAMMSAEDTAFFAWCVWNRNAREAGNPTEEWEPWSERLAALDMDRLESEAPDPTPAPSG